MLVHHAKILSNQNITSKIIDPYYFRTKEVKKVLEHFAGVLALIFCSDLRTWCLKVSGLWSCLWTIFSLTSSMNTSSQSELS